MKKKILVTMLTATMALAMVACGGDTSDTKVIEGSSSAPAAAASQGVAASKGYVFSHNGMDFVVDSDASVLTDALGEPNSYFESPSCAGEGIGKLYTYTDFEIQTYPDNDKDLVLYVMLRTDNVATNEGIDLSKTKEDVIAVYGEPTAQTGDSLTYEKDGMKLNFLFDGEDMISIEYDSSKN